MGGKDLGISQIRTDMVKVYMSETQAGEMTLKDNLDISAWETDEAITIDTAHLANSHFLSVLSLLASLCLILI